MQYQRPERRVIRIRKLVDQGVQAVATLSGIFEARGVDERRVAVVREEWVRELFEEVF